MLNITLFAKTSNDVDCILLADEDSIVCKYTHIRADEDHKILIQWIEPDGTVTRQRDMIIPAHHGSVYDYRYITGRTKGLWTFKVIDNNQEYKTHFTIE